MTTRTSTAGVPALTGPGSEQDDVVGLRLHSRSPVTPQWLTRSVVPALRRLRDDEAAGVAYLRPGWLHGPHVELVARPSDGRAPLPWDDVAAGLDAGPADAATALSEEAYLAQARELGRLERVAPPYLPMAEHGAVTSVRAADLGSWPAPLDTVRELVLTQLGGAVTGTAEQLTATPEAATRRLAEVFVALASAHRWGAAFGVFSLRSHAEAFLAWASATTDARPAFARRLDREGPLLREVVEQALAREHGPHAAAWHSALAYGSGVLDAAVGTGALTSAFVDELAGEDDGSTTGPPGAVPGQRTTPSAFHQAVDASGVVDRPSDWFASYRVLLNLVYSQLPLLGVPPMHRYWCCYAVASTVDEVLGETWETRLARAGRVAARTAR